MSFGPELRGGNITLDMIFNKSDPIKRHTKIFCTLGPACWDVPTLEAMIHAGMNVARSVAVKQTSGCKRVPGLLTDTWSLSFSGVNCRFNFSHGDHEGHKDCLDRLHEAIKNTGKHVGT
jgi:pyruvate kinase